MSMDVDHRVVEMQFDNKQFEEGINTSIDSLDKLKQSLDLEDSAKSIKKISRAGKNFDLDNMSEAAEKVSNRFTLLGNLTDQVFTRISNAAINAGLKFKSLIDQFTIDPIRSGLEEYETQINSVQTILANTRDAMTKLGYDDNQRLDIINDRLDQLNHYADKTIYNFTQMTESIGRFTAAGVDLDPAVNAIQGIANLAALSGSNAEQASNAMYMLSQAISTGQTQLYHWNSIVRAGMGGEITQQALIKTAMAMGVTVDKTVEQVDASGKKIKKTVKRTVKDLMEIDHMSFRDTLSTGWLSGEVWTKTLERMSWDFEEMAKKTHLTDEQKQSLLDEYVTKFMGEGDDADTALRKAQKIVSDVTDLSVEEVKAIKKAQLIAEGFTETEAEEWITLADEGIAAAQKVKTVTQLFDTLREAAQSGWTQTWEYIIGDFYEAREFFTGLSDFFGGLIDASSEARNEIVRQWKERGGRDLLLNKDPQNGPLGAIWNLIYGFQNIANTVREGLSSLFPKITGDTLLSITKRINEATASFKRFTENQKVMGTFKRILSGVASVFGIIGDAIKGAWRAITQLFSTSDSESSSFFEIFATIGDWIVNLRTLIQESGVVETVMGGIVTAITTVGQIANSVFQSVSSWMKSIGESEAFQKISTSIRSAFSKISEWFSGFGIDSVGGFFSGILEAMKSAGAWLKSNLVDPIVNWVKNLLGIHSPSTVFAEIGRWIVEGLGSGIKNAWSAFVGFFKGLWDKISNSDFVKNVLDKVKPAFDKIRPVISKVVATGKTILNTIVAIVSTLASFAAYVGVTLVSAIAVGIKYISKWSKNIGEAVKKTEVFQKVSKWFKSAFSAISEWFGGLKGESDLSFIDMIKDRFSGLVEFFEKFKGNFGKPGNRVMDVFSDWMLVVKDKLSRGWNGIKTVLSTVFNFFKSLNWGAIFGLAAGGAAVVGLVKVVASIISITTNIAKLTKGIANLGTGLAKFFKRGGKITTVVKKKDTLGSTMLKIASAIGILVASLYVLANMDADKVKRGGVILAILAGALLAASFLFKTVKVDEMPILKLAGALALLMVPIGLLAIMPGPMVAKGLGLLALILTGLWAFSAALGKSGVGIGKWTGLLSLAGALTILMIPIKILAGMDFWSATGAILGIGALLGELAVFAKLIPATNAGSFKFKGFFALAAAITLLMVPLKVLAGMPILDMLKGLGGLGAILVGMSIFANKTNGTSVKGLLSMSIALGVIALSIRSLSRIPLPALGKGMGALALLMVGFGTIASTSKTLTTKGMLLSVGSLAAIMLVFVYSLREISNVGIDGDFMNGFAVSFAAMLVSLSYAIGITSKIPFGMALKGLATLVIALGAIGTITGILGMIENNGHDISGSLATGGKILGALGKGIGSFVGSIVNGFVTSAIDLPKLGSDLSAFMTNAQGFIDGAKKIKKDTLTGASNLTGVILKISAVEFLTGLINLVNIFGEENPIESFGEKIKTLGKALADYGTEISPLSSLPDGALDRANETATALATLNQSLPRTGGLVQFIAGSKNLETFSTGIKYVAEALKSYATEISGISNDADEADFTAANDSATSLSTLNASLPRSGGWLQTIIGEKDLERFATGIKAIAEALKAYATNISGISEKAKDEDFSAAASSSSSLATLMGSIPRWFGLFDLIRGVQNPWLFAEAIPVLAKILKTYCEGIQGIGTVADEKDLASAKIAAEGLAALNKSLPRTNGALQWWIGTQDLGLFATNIQLLGTALKAYVEAFSGIDVSGATDATDVVERLSTLMGTLKKSGGFFTVLGDVLMGTQETTLLSYSNTIKTVGSDLSDFCNNVSEVNTGKTDGAFKVIDSITSLLSTLPGSGGFFDVLAALFVGTPEETLLNYTSTMTTVGKNLNAFCMSVATIDTSGTDEAFRVLGSINGFFDQMQGKGFLQSILEFFGEESKEETLIKYSGSMVTIGENLAKFCTNISSVSTTNTDSAFTVLGAITSFFDSMEGEDLWGRIQRFFGVESKEETLVGYSETMVKVGENLQTFASSLTDTSYLSKTNDAITIMGLIQGFTQDLKGEKEEKGFWGNLIDYFNGDELVTASNNLATFGANFSAFATNISGATMAAWNFGVVRTIFESFNTISKAIESGEIDTSSIITYGSVISNTLIQAFGGGIIDEASSVSKAFTIAAQIDAATIDSVYRSWYEVGQHISEGLAKGISDMQGYVEGAAVKVANSVVSSMRETLDIHSPSRRTKREIGDPSMAGFGSSFLDRKNQRSIFGSADKMIKATVTHMQATLSSASYLGGGGIVGDVQKIVTSKYGDLVTDPNYAPILEATGLGSVFNKASSDTTDAAESAVEDNLNAISSGGGIIVNFNDKNIVERLDSLEDRLVELADLIDNMELVLDTGAVVGGIATKMDSELGTLQMRRGRGG